MTQIAITKQIEAIKKVTEEALKSKEAAHKFLVEAGIVKEKKGEYSKDIGRSKK